jgi:hypothetical protein
MRKVPAVSSFRFPEYKSAHLKFPSSYTPQFYKGVIMKNVSRFLLSFILLACAVAFAQTGPPISKPGPTPIVHPVPGRMPPGLLSQITPPIIVAKPPTAPMPIAPRNPAPAPRLVSQVGPPIIVVPPSVPMPPNAPRNPAPAPRLVSQVSPPIIIAKPPTAPMPPNAPRNPVPAPRLG